MHWRRKWQPTPGFLPGESQGQGSLVGCRLWGRTESDTTEATWRRRQRLRILHYNLSKSSCFCNYTPNKYSTRIRNSCLNRYHCDWEGKDEVFLSFKFFLFFDFIIPVRDQTTGSRTWVMFTRKRQDMRSSCLANHVMPATPVTETKNCLYRSHHTPLFGALVRFHCAGWDLGPSALEINSLLAFALLWWTCSLGGFGDMGSVHNNSFRLLITVNLVAFWGSQTLQGLIVTSHD